MRRFISIIAFVGGICLLGNSPTCAQTDQRRQHAPPDAFVDGSPLAYYGSDSSWVERRFAKNNADQTPKRRGQRQMLAILTGQFDDAVRYANQCLKSDPQDTEAMFTRTIAYCQLGQLDEAWKSMREAVDAGLPVERFQAGPRHLLRALTETANFRAFAEQRTNGLIHGPLLGCVTDKAARVWLRTWEATPVKINVFANEAVGQFSSVPVVTVKGTTNPSSDYTAVLTLDGLQPETRYSYQVLLGQKVVSAEPFPEFKTLTEIGKPTQLSVAFGGGAGFTPAHERMWDTIASHHPDVLFLMGDNVYIDLAEQPSGLHRYTYYRRQSRPEFRRLVSTTPTYAIWDDHDCGVDDVWMGPYLDRPSWKSAMLNIFNENWNNPAYGSSTEPGCWFSKSIGNIDFFFLDTRYFRTNPGGAHPAMLGPEQKAWLLQQLKTSQAAFKVIVSSVPFVPGAKPGSRDTWDGFVEERQSILDTIVEHKIDGVLLLSADRHRSDARKLDLPGSYSIYEFMSSRLTNMHVHKCIEESIFCYNDGCSFGRVTFDTQVADPTVTYDVVNIDGDVVHSLELRLSELRIRKSN